MFDIWSKFKFKNQFWTFPVEVIKTYNDKSWQIRWLQVLAVNCQSKSKFYIPDLEKLHEENWVLQERNHKLYIWNTIYVPYFKSVKCCYVAKLYWKNWVLVKTKPEIHETDRQWYFPNVNTALELWQLWWMWKIKRQVFPKKKKVDNSFSWKDVLSFRCEREERDIINFLSWR